MSGAFGSVGWLSCRGPLTHSFALSCLQVGYLESVGKLPNPAYAGYVCVDNTSPALYEQLRRGSRGPLPGAEDACDSNLYYWYSPMDVPEGAAENVDPTKPLPPGSPPPSEPLIVFLGGGMRLEESALQGAFASILPYVFLGSAEAELAGIVEIKNLDANPRSWTRRGHVIALESVLGVGFAFSHSGARRDSTAHIAADVRSALATITQRYPLLQNRRVVLVGTGAMAQVIPLVAHGLLVDSGAEEADAAIEWPVTIPRSSLKYAGAVVLSGVFDPAVQFAPVPRLLKQVCSKLPPALDWCRSSCIASHPYELTVRIPTHPPLPFHPIPCSGL